MIIIIINVKKTCQFKTWCKDDKSNIENNTDHLFEDTRQNALAAVTKTHFYCLDPSSIDETIGDFNEKIILDSEKKL